MGNTMTSGVGINDACLSEYQLLKLKKAYKYIVFNLSKDNTEIIVEKTSTSPDYDNFIEDLPETECRWAVYNFEFEKAGAGKRNKLTFVSWAPDTAKIKQKMLFASSKDALRKALVGIAVEIQGTEYNEVSYASLLDKASRGN
ncbi:actin-binding ADF family protein [Streptomyces sp. NPDC057287]|uniref:actin-binding ADF family protein n=1 Tax=Streptomyces sp. NPDC057287 TaxID=3346086 RepID=UPI003636004F